MMPPRFFLIFLIALVVSCTHDPSVADLEKGFINPPDSARPSVWWHWLNENISKDGITRDLEAMAAQGLGGATIFNLGGQAVQGPATYGSDQWQECVNHAFAEAKRLGLELSFQNCGGWATSGGPWVTPASEISLFRLLNSGPQKQFLRSSVLDTGIVTYKT